MFYFIVNKKGGSGKAEKTWQKIESWLKTSDVEYKVCESLAAGHVTQIAKEICEIPDNQDSNKKIILVGGDGTLNEILNGITDFSKIKFGIIPTGSGNDFARGLGINKKQVIKNLQRVTSNENPRLVDMGLLHLEDGNQRYFGISSGIGMDAIVCKRTNTSRLKIILNKIHLGQLSYILLTVHSLFSMKCRDVTVKFDDEEPVIYKKLIMMAGMNLPAEGGGVKMAPDAVCDDGELSVCIVQNIPKLRAFFVFPFLILGKHKGHKGFIVRNFRKMEMTSSETVVTHTDGEWSGDVTKISMECIHRKLQLLN